MHVTHPGKLQCVWMVPSCCYIHAYIRLPDSYRRSGDLCCSKRFFRLDANARSLLYFLDADERAERGAIALEGATVAQGEAALLPTDDDWPDRARIVIVRDRSLREWRLRAQNESQAAQTVDVLRLAGSLFAPAAAPPS